MNDTRPGLCVHCHSPVHPGREGLIRPGGQLSHRSCWTSHLAFEREEGRNDRLVIIVAFALMAAAVGLMVFALSL